MWETLQSNVKTTLESITSVKEAFTERKTKLTKFPCVYFQPIALDNTFETNVENYKVYKFELIPIVGKHGSGATRAQIELYLMRVVDDIVEEFDTNWNQGTIEGHRVTARLSTVSQPLEDPEQDGLTLYWPMVLEVKLLTTN